MTIPQGSGKTTIPQQQETIMTTLACLTLIVYMEARSEPELAQQLVAQVAINRAKSEGTTLCKSMRKPRSYSFYWDKKSNKITEKSIYRNIISLSSRVLEQDSLANRLYFNECFLGKRYKSEYKMKRVGNLCFY